MPLLAIAVVAMLGACRGDIAGGSADGARVYAEACATCHGPVGVPPPARVSQLGVRDLTAPELRARITRDLVIAQVRRGSDNKLMPSFYGALTEAQIQAVADYVLRDLAPVK